jgi:endo-alpha-1,4-polygalactosaminidase (GH114 family)
MTFAGDFAFAVVAATALLPGCKASSAGTSTGTVATHALSSVGSFEYVIAANSTTTGIDADLAASRADLIILGGDPPNAAPLDRASIDPNGQKLIFGYIDTCEASSYWYPSLFAGGTTPPWFGNPNPGFPGLYTVQYWNPAWEPLLLTKVDELIANGYDGIFLDVLDGSSEWATGNRENNPVYASGVQAMATLLGDIRSHIRQAYPGQTVYLLGNNPTQLAMQFPKDLQNLDAIFNEVAFYGQNPTDGSVSVYEGTANAAYIQSTLAPLYDATGLPVLGNDYPSPLTDDSAVYLSFSFYSALGWTPSVTTPKQTANIFSTGPFLFMATPTNSSVTGDPALTNFLSGGKVLDATLHGGNQGDTFIGGPGQNTIVGGAGNDMIYAHPANAADRGQIIFELSSTIKGAATQPSASISINQQVVVPPTSITAVSGTGTQTLAVDATSYLPISSVVLTVSGTSYGGQADFSNVEIDALSYDGVAISAALATYSNGNDANGYAYSNNGTVSFPASAFTVQSPFPANTSDVIDGKGGMNTVVYRGAHESYTATKEADGTFVVTSSSTAEGPDTLTNIQTLTFSDLQMTLE